MFRVASFLFLLSAGYIAQAQGNDCDMIGNAMRGVVIVTATNSQTHAVDGMPLTVKSLGIAGSEEGPYRSPASTKGLLGWGSGFVVEHGGALYVITNAHVVEEIQQKDSIFCKDIDGQRHRTRLKGLDSYYDVAVLEFVEPRQPKLPALRFAKGGTLRVGTRIYSIGNPSGGGQMFHYTVTEGIISALNRSFERTTSRQDYIQHTAVIMPGNSGGPIVSLQGEVAGINTLGGAGGMYNFAVASETAERVAVDLIDRGYVRRSYLGVHFGQRYQEETRFDFPTLKHHPVYVEIDETPAVLGVLPGSAAASRMGAHIGHHVIAVNGAAIESKFDLMTLIEQHDPAKLLTLTLRDGQGRTIDVQIPVEELRKPQLEQIASYTLSHFYAMEARQDAQGVMISRGTGKKRGDVVGQKGEALTIAQGTRILAAGSYPEDKDDDGQMWRVTSLEDLGKIVRLVGHDYELTLLAGDWDDAKVVTLLFRSGENMSVAESLVIL